ncbi:MAG: Hsp20 family protein [Actinomycetota bacterium]
MKPVLAHKKKEIPVHPQEPSAFMKEVTELFNRIEKRAYELFEGRGREEGRDLDDWFKAESELFKPVPLETEEDEKQLTIRAKVPGFHAEELEINLEPSVLTIKGAQRKEMEKKEKGAVYTKTREQEIFRRVALPVGVLPDAAEANLKDDVLEITVPKAAEAKKIRVVAA